MAKQYKPFHKVMIVLNGTDGITDGMRRYNEQIFRVNKVKTLRKGATNFITLYELRDCKSEAGVPYTFIGDWLYDIGAWTE